MKKKVFAAVTAATMMVASFGGFAVTTQAADFPAYDFEGRTIRFQLPDWADPDRVGAGEQEFWQNRKDEVEAKFNVKLQTNNLEGIGWNDIPGAIAESIAAGDPLVDMYVSMTVYYNTTIFGGGHAYDLTDTVKSWNMPSFYYAPGQGMWHGRVMGFTDGPLGNMHTLVYNRELIRDAGMDKDIGEMILAGTWSWDEAFEYLMELNSRLPDDVWVFSMHLNHLVRNFVFSNGLRILDPVTNIPNFTRPEYYAAMEFFNKCYQAGLIQPPQSITSTLPTGLLNSANWGAPIGSGFTEGNHVIHWAGSWTVGDIAAAIDFGTMLWPWGPNVTIENNDYTTLSDNYNTFTVDLGINVIMNHAVEQYGIPAEAYLNLFWSYMHGDQSDQLDQDRINEAAGLPAHRGSRGTPRNFYTDYDIEIFDFWMDRIVFEPMESNGTFAAFSMATSATGPTTGFFGMHQRIVLNNASPREIMEGFFPAALYGMVYNGLIERSDLTPAQLAMIDTYTVSVAQVAESRLEDAAIQAVKDAIAHAFEALESLAELNVGTDAQIQAVEDALNAAQTAMEAFN